MKNKRTEKLKLTKSVHSKRQITNLADIAYIVWKRGNNIVFLDAVE